MPGAHLFRFLHTSDLHLGKRFGRLPEALRNRLSEARHGAIHRLAAAARDAGAGTVLVAGDVFDSETPASATLRQALAAMAEEPVTWVLLPGNHDSLAAGELWAQVVRHRPSNVVPALAAEPLALAPGVMLLPAPCTHRNPGRDLTAWMDAAETAPGVLRIGLAHGAVQEFGEEGAREVIDPRRADLARLDYLALGDWHGQMRLGARAWYSGTPEPDRFKHGLPGTALVVALEAPGAPPSVTPVETGAFRWEVRALDMLAGEDPVARLEAVLPGANRRHVLLRLVVAGRMRLSDRAALEAAIGRASPELAWLERDDSGIALDCDRDDLDAIAPAGALREAAEALLADTLAEGLAPAERQAARAALARLHGFAAEP
jgi:DNA repair exonuclease SbcCD nuclease subunit